MTTVDGPSLPGDTHPYALWDAAYVLGSLSCAERRAFEAHIKGCASCADAVSDLGGMRALLAQIDRGYVDTLDEADGPAGFPPPRNELLVEVTTRRRRSRAASWTFSAAAAVAIGLFAAVESSPMAALPAPQPGQASALTMTPTKPVPLTATVTLTRWAWGTRIEMQCTYEAGPIDADYHGDEAGDKLAMVAVGRDGSRTQLATWTARIGMPDQLGGSTSMPVDQIASVQIVSADAGAVLLERDL